MRDVKGWGRIAITAWLGLLCCTVYCPADEIVDGYLAERDTELYQASEQAAAARQALEKARLRLQESHVTETPETGDNGYDGLQEDIQALETLRDRLAAELSTLRDDTLTGVASAPEAPEAPEPAVEAPVPAPIPALPVVDVSTDVPSGVVELAEDRLAVIEAELGDLRSAQTRVRDQQAAAMDHMSSRLQNEVDALKTLQQTVQQELTRIAETSGGGAQAERFQKLEDQLNRLSGALPDSEQRRAEMETYRASLLDEVQGLYQELKAAWTLEAGALAQRLDEQDLALEALGDSWGEALQRVSQAASDETRQAAAAQEASIEALRQEVFVALEDLAVAEGPGATEAVGQRLVQLRRELDEQMRDWQQDMEARLADLGGGERQEVKSLQQEWQAYKGSLEQELAAWKDQLAQRQQQDANRLEAALQTTEKPVSDAVPEAGSDAAMSAQEVQLQRERTQLIALKELVSEALGSKHDTAAARRAEIRSGERTEAEQRVEEKAAAQAGRPVGGEPPPAPVVREIPEETGSETTPDPDLPPPAMPEEDLTEAMEPEPFVPEADVEETPEPAPATPDGDLEETAAPSEASDRPAISRVPRQGDGAEEHRGAIDTFLLAAADAALVPDMLSGTAAGNLLSPEQAVLLRNGWEYTGGWTEGRMHGQGTMVYPDGQSYTGAWENGSREGRGILRHPSGWNYDGEWSEGLMHGGGTLSYSDGWSFTGTFFQGSLTGGGRLQHPDGWTYAGSWRDGVMEGEGILSYPDGWMYEGSWADGQRQGEGTLHHPQGWTYTGQWDLGVWNGLGTLQYTDGWKYSGEWQDGRMHGRGTLTSPEGWEYTGQWKQGAMEGEGDLRAVSSTDPMEPMTR